MQISYLETKYFFSIIKLLLGTYGRILPRSIKQNIMFNESGYRLVASETPVLEHGLFLSEAKIPCQQVEYINGISFHTKRGYQQNLSVLNPYEHK
jgi:hypothetical protein